MPFHRGSGLIDSDDIPPVEDPPYFTVRSQPPSPSPNNIGIEFFESFNQAILLLHAGCKRELL
jgi:hypothetical protein